MSINLSAFVVAALASAATWSSAADAAPLPSTSLPNHDGSNLVTQIDSRGFGAGLAGGVVGGIIGGALVAPRAYGGTYYVERPYYPPTYYYEAPPPPPPPRVYYEPAAPEDAHSYCMRRFRSYDPRTGTYLGYDGYRYPCP